MLIRLVVLFQLFQAAYAAVHLQMGFPIVVLIFQAAYAAVH